MSDNKPRGFGDADLERFLVLLDQRQLSQLTVKSLVWQFKKQKEKLRVAISLASHKFDCTIMTNGKHECSCGYNELKGGSE